MDKAKAAAKRRKIYPKMQRAYSKALQKSSGQYILTRLEAISDTKEVASLIAGTGEVGREMRSVDAKKKWPADLGVGSVYGMWREDWSMAAVFAIGRAFDRRDGTALPEDDVWRFMSNRLEQFTGTELNLHTFLRVSESEQITSFLQEVLDTPA